jgi:hypothetical protein
MDKENRKNLQFLQGYLLTRFVNNLITWYLIHSYGKLFLSGLGVINFIINKFL